MKKSKVLLDVPHVQQISEKASLAACTEMVLKFCGDSMSQREIYQTAKSGDGGPSTDVGIALAVKDLGYKVVSWWNENKGMPKGQTEFMQNFYWPIYWRVVQLGVLEKKEDADIFLIRELIDKGVPVIAEIDNGKLYGRKTTGIHSILIKGYSRTHFTYNDPSFQNSSSKTIDFKEFEGVWEETLLARRSISVIVKKDQKI